MDLRAGPREQTGRLWRLRIVGVVSGLFLLLTLAFMWPLPARANRSIPDHDDAYFSVWRVAWIAHQLPRDPRHLFDANIFHPEENTLAFSDAAVLPAVLGAPAIWLGASPVAVYNWLLILGVATSALAAYLLTERLSGSAPGAIIAGVVFAFAPYRAAHFAHLELQWTAFMPLALLAMHRLHDRPTTAVGIGLGAAIGLQALSSIYYAAFFAVMCVPACVWLVVAARRPRRPTLAALAYAAVVTLILVLPYGRPYLTNSTERSAPPAEEVATFAARWGDYLRVPPHNRLRGGAGEAPEERSLYPGLVAPALAAVAAVPPASIATYGYVAMAAAAVDGSRGSEGHVFRFLRWIGGPFAYLRASARFAILFLLALSVLAGLGFARLTARIGPRHRWTVFAAAMAACALEFNSTPMPLRDPAMSPPAVYRWLRQQSRAAVVIELPVPAPDRLWGYETTYQYLSTFHWMHLVNGYSGFAPQSYLRLLESMRTFPDAASMASLRRRSVNYVVVHDRLMPHEEYVKLSQALLLRTEVQWCMEFPDPVYPAAVCRLR